MSTQPLETRRALILVVDDKQSNIQVVGGTLAAQGFDVMPALSAAQALERMRARMPDLILLDMMMPQMDGFELVALLQADRRYAGIPVIFLTAAHERELLIRAFESGAVDYVTKPFVPTELLARVRTHVELKRARDHLKLVSDECAALTQIVAHDLKSPLSNIHFSAQMLSKALATNPTRAPALIEAIDQSAQRALLFIERYLGRCADGELKRRFELSGLDLNGLAARACDAVAAHAQACAIEVVRSQSDVRVQVYADEVAALHVIENLLSNAIKYSPSGGTVEVWSGRGNPGMGRVCVLDRGTGISPESQRLLFRRYARLELTEKAAHSTGLGLAICKQEATQMGGQLWYEDREGGGSVFILELPQPALAG